MKLSSFDDYLKTVMTPEEIEEINREALSEVLKMHGAELSSGNVFADLELSNPEERLKEANERMKNDLD